MLEVHILIILAIVIIYLGWNINKKDCPPVRVVYKLVPRTFQEESIDQIKPSSLFNGLWNNIESRNS